MADHGTHEVRGTAGESTDIRTGPGVVVGSDRGSDLGGERRTFTELETLNVYVYCELAVCRDQHVDNETNPSKPFSAKTAPGARWRGRKQHAI